MNTPHLLAPLSRILRADHTPPRLRRIESEYHLELVADNTAQIVAHQAELLAYQARAAETNLRGMGEIARRQDLTNALAESNLQAIDELAQRQEETNVLLGVGFGALAEGMDRLSETIGDGFENVGESIERLQLTTERGLQAVVEALETVSQQLWKQQEALDAIVELLRRPYGTQAQELLREANKWLEQGARRDGRDRDEDWKDAMGLLQEVINNRIGKQDYVAWFQIGWLQWKHKADFHAAEEAFYQSQRLSASSQQSFHVKGLRYQAYMQYLQDRPEEAYQTIVKARVVSEDHDTLYDIARYAAKTGRQEESLRLLERCIELQPTTYVTMFSEEDFQ